MKEKRKEGLIEVKEKDEDGDEVGTSRNQGGKRWTEYKRKEVINKKWKVCDVCGCMEEGTFE